MKMMFSTNTFTINQTTKSVNIEPDRGNSIKPREEISNLNTNLSINKRRRLLSIIPASPNCTSCGK